MEDDDFYWVPIPMLISDSFDGRMRYKWKYIEKRYIPEKNGYGIVVIENIRKGFRIPMGGILITPEQRQLVLNDPDKERSSYLAIGNVDVFNEPRNFLDAHKSLYPTNVPDDAWIGSFCNMPSIGEVINAELLRLPIINFF